MGVGSSYNDNSYVWKKCSYGPHNYKGNHLMMRTQWRRHQRNKKAPYEALGSNNNSKVYAYKVDKNGLETSEIQIVTSGGTMEKKFSDQIAQPDDEMVTYNFDSVSKDYFEVTFNIVLVLPREYDRVS